MKNKVEEIAAKEKPNYENFPPEFYMLGKQRTRPLVNMALRRDDVSIQDLVAAAYLQGVWDGWKVCEGNLSKAKKFKG